MLAAPARAQHGVDLVDEDDAGLEFAGEGEDGIDELIAVAVPFLRQRRDMQVDERGAGFVRERFRKHGLAAAGRAVEQHPRGSGEQRGGVRVEMRHRERVDDGFFELGDYGREPADVFECHGDVFGRDDVHRDGLLVFVEDQVFFAGALVGVVGGEVIFGGGGAVQAPEDRGSGGAFGFGFFVGEGLLGFDAGEGVADEVVDGDVLGGGRVVS